MKLLLEISRPGKGGAPPRGTRRAPLPEKFRRVRAPRLPEVTENEIVRHFTNLSRVNFSVDGNFYPLGSCTMKYNPRWHNEIVKPFAPVHPLDVKEAPATPVGAPPRHLLDILHRLERALSLLAGMDAFSLAPAAGAQGELSGVLILRAHFRDRGEARGKILIPDTAHGTNPASAAMAGFETVQVATGPEGDIDLIDLERKMTGETAGLMLTNPSTLGLFDRGIREIAEIVHDKKGLLYYDGANLNAVVGRFAPGRMGFDLCHLNLHKTFAVPHGGGGPGAGPIGARGDLVKYLPVPVVARRGEKILLEEEGERPDSIGRLHAYHGNVLALVRAWAYIAELGGEGLAEASGAAVLSANYLKKRLEDVFPAPYPKRRVAHEVLLSAARLKKETGTSALDVAKALIDEGIHPPTIYFPLLVPEAMLIEPTETESLETLETFVTAMRRIAQAPHEEAAGAPRTTPISRPDETRAARNPKVRA